MATPRDNTEVFRMLRDFKNAVYRSGTPLKLSSPNFTEAFDPSNVLPSRRANATDIVTKLNFSHLDDTTRLGVSVSTPSSKSESIFQTPDILKRKLASTELELKASKAALKEKETAISMMEPANKKACLSLEQKLKNSLKQNEMDKETIIKLRNQLKYTEEEAAFSKSRVAELERAKKTECEKLEMRLLALHQECGDLKIEISQAKSEKAEVVRRLHNEIERLELKLGAVCRENSRSEERNVSLKKQVQELSEKAAQADRLKEELHSAQEHIKSLESRIEAEKDAALIVKAKQSDLKLLSEVQDENKRLREELGKYKDSNVALFQEKMWAFQEKGAEMDKKNATIAKLEVENERLSKRISEWESLFDENGGISNRSPSSFTRRLSQYQKNEANLLHKITKLGAHCESLEKKVKEYEVDMEQMKKRYEQMKENAGNYDPLVKRLRQKIMLLTKERESCRKLIDSYVSESTISGSVLNTNHIKHLESTIVEYEKSLEKADEEVDELEAKVKILKEKANLLTQTEAVVRELRAEKIQLLEKIEELENEKSELEKRLASRNKETHTSGEKIIHLRSNPVDDAMRKNMADLVALRDENDRLRKRVQVLEEEGASASNVTLKVQEKLEKEGSDTLLSSLKEQLASAERQNKMIMDAARTKSREFREAVYSLTGYKIDVPVSGKFKLSHVYSDSPDDHLLFEVDSNGVNLLETEFSNHLTAEIETYLHTYDSVPAFLASVTLDLFKQQTYLAQSTLSMA